MRSPGPLSFVLLCAVVAGQGAGCRRQPPVERVSAEESFRRPAQLIASLDLRAGAAVAEVGAGRGLVTLHLARAVGPTGRVVATDVDASVLELLRERAGSLGLRNIETRRVTAQDSGLEARAYDLILLSFVDHLLADRGAYLRGLIPALKPDGRIVIVNREDRMAAARAAAESAGLRIEEGTAELPGQRVLRLRPR